jgi:hypothetical protein
VTAEINLDDLLRADADGADQHDAGGVMTDTANLQSPRPIKQLAAAGVSERSMYTAISIRRSGRQDVIAAVERGEMSLHKASKIINATPGRTRLDRLVTAWRLASDGDRRRFIDWIAENGERAAA